MAIALLIPKTDYYNNNIIISTRRATVGVVRMSLSSDLGWSGWVHGVARHPCAHTPITVCTPYEHPHSNDIVIMVGNAINHWTLLVWLWLIALPPDRK